MVRNLARANCWLAAIAVAGVVMLSSCGAPVYAATSTSPSAAPTTVPSSPATAKRHPLRRGLLARTDHATLEVRQGGRWVTVDVDRGNVTSASTSSITLSRPDGRSVTLQLSSSTRFRGKVATSASALRTGVRALVVSENGTARSVTEGAKPLRAAH